MERISAKSMQILLLGEHLRVRLHNERDPGDIIKDRRYHLRLYPCCFVGRDVVDWLVHHGEAVNRTAAVQCMCILQENNIIHHVCDDHMFKDEMLFYRFRRDDNTLPITHDVALVIRGYNISQRIKADDCHLVKQQQCEDFVYRSCFIGSSLVDWMVERGETNDRFEAVLLGRELLEIGLMKHVTDDHHFKDDPSTYYQFVIEKVFAKKLMEALCLLEGRQLSLPPGSPREVRKKNLSLLMGGRSIPVPLSPSREARGNEFTGFRQSPGSPDSGGSPGNFSPRPVIVREVTVDELLDNNGPYTMKTIRVMSDAVGFGFVVRGSEPVFVQTVDPSGPAAAAGLKVRMFIHSVNGKEVLHWTHKEVAKEILRGQNVLDLVVMTHFRGS
ncbi:DEP domain-containing mTOR-interacting protein [Nematostella vectensis]|uniref:DEP domain-containing mTOR-interacting protein n=1 Tax=Nematostella vectensis TaxID=45351 RepID=UPI00207737C6|nr:DEP domain-containing mTOR-interacting protein [Nematostella vectensis]